MHYSLRGVLPMKRAYLATLTITLLTATSAYAAINCATPPTCAELGYTDTVANCSGDSIKCPFDTTVGKCLSAGPTVGQIGYFPKEITNTKWIKCDGRYLNRYGYPELYEFLGRTFGGVDDLFKVPDYSGDFVRVYKSGLTQATNVRQLEGLPNIYGHFGLNGKTSADEVLFSKVTMSTNYEGIGNGDYTKTAVRFDASKYNPIYGANVHVTPVNTAVYAYIYAGKVDTAKSSIKDLPKDCQTNYYYYQDGTCSQTRNTSKGLKGIVRYVSKGSSSSYVQYVTGGSTRASTYENANASCAMNYQGGIVVAPSVAAEYIGSKVTSATGDVSPVSTSKTYWGVSSNIYTCSSTTSCSPSGTPTSGTYYYFYCQGQDYFY